MSKQNSHETKTAISYFPDISPGSEPVLPITVAVQPPEINANVSGRLKASGIQENSSQYMVIATEQGDVAIQTQVVLTADPPPFVEGRGIELEDRKGKHSVGWEVLASNRSIEEVELVPEQHIERYELPSNKLIKLVGEVLHEALDAAAYLDYDMGWSPSNPPPAYIPIPEGTEEETRQLWKEQSEAMSIAVIVNSRHHVDQIIRNATAFIEDLKVLGDRPVIVQQSMIQYLRGGTYPQPASAEAFKAQVESAKLSTKAKVSKSQRMRIR